MTIQQISGEDNTQFSGQRAEDFVPRFFEPNHTLDRNNFQKLQGGAREIHFSNDEFFNPTKSVKSVLIDGVELSAGDRVCIRPSCPTDALDIILAGKTAVIEALEQDVGGQIHLGLALEGDSQGYLDAVRQSGYRFFYPADEVEPCKREVAS